MNALSTAVVMQIEENLDIYCFELTSSKIFSFRAISRQNTAFILAHMRILRKMFSTH